MILRTINRCPACDHADASTVAQLDEVSRQRFIDFDRLKYGGLLKEWIEVMQLRVLVCNICGHAWYFQQPEPKQLSLMYASGRSLIAGALHSNVPTDAMQNEMRRFRRLVGVTIGSPLLLDYGSGRGRWARAALLEGFRVVAYEPSVERGGEVNPPFHLVHSESELANMRFDAIHLEQVLEHVADPFQTLTQMRNYCYNHTIIRITVPNVNRDPSTQNVWKSWPWDGKVPHVLAPFEHLHGFTPESLERLCLRSGYQPLSPFRIVRTHPINLLRRLIGSLWPSIGTTAQYLVPQPRRP